MFSIMNNQYEYWVAENVASSQRASLFRKKLIQWFKKNRRHFDWRETKDPYTILVSEVLLQRTQAPQVAMHFNNIIRLFPTLDALRGSKYDEVSRAIQPLGLAKRAGTLIAMAEVLADRFEGEIPADPNLLGSLPGVGRYIASATACFAFGRRISVVDTNVVRIFSRYFGITSNKKRPHEDPQVWKLAELLLPNRKVEDYNWALIDFAALICTARKPACSECPMKRGCCFTLNFLSI